MEYAQSLCSSFKKFARSIIEFYSEELSPPEDNFFGICTYLFYLKDFGLNKSVRYPRLFHSLWKTQGHNPKS